VLELRLLGPVSLIGVGGREIPGLLAQPRRLALLAYLVAAMPRGMHRRDSVSALFWPELDQTHARAALRQTVYLLRAALGAEVISSRGDEEIGFGFEAVRCDVVAFEDAVVASRFEDALELYRGHFLSAFFITGAAEFEQWLERERGRLHAAAAHAAEGMTGRAEAAGDLASAAFWARRAVHLAPHDEAAARRLIDVLARRGDRTGAMDAYRELAKRLADVYEVEPSPETEELIRAVRAPTAVMAPNDNPVAAMTTTPSRAGGTRSVRSGGLNRWRAPALGVLGTLLLFGVASSGAPRRDSLAAPHRRVSAVAILPLTYAPSERALGNTADELLEALTTDVGRTKGLRVTAQRAATSVAPNAALQTIGRQLDVDAVVEGTIRRAGDQLFVDMTLLDVSSSTQRWSERFVGDVGHPMALESHIVRKLSTALGVPLSAADLRSLEAVPTNSSQAYEQFLNGKIHLRYESRADDSLAIVFFERAVSLDPGFAMAYAFLARAYGLRALQFAPEDTTASERALLAVDKSLALEPDLAEAHWARGMILWGPRNHFTVEFAVREYRRALELNPNLDDAHHQLGVVYLHVGLLDKAVAELEKTLALDPGNRFAEHRIGVALVDEGRYEEGLRALRAVPASFNPALWYYHVTWALLYLGRDAEASALIDEYLLKHPEDRGGVVTSIRAILHAKRGDTVETEHDVRAAETLGKGYVHFHHTEYNIASAYALLRRPRAAIPWLRRAADDGWPCYPAFANDPNLNAIRSDPEFIALLADLRAQWDRYRATL
jgi:serine/threonine-protein kinase